MESDGRNALASRQQSERCDQEKRERRHRVIEDDGRHCHANTSVAATIVQPRRRRTMVAIETPAAEARGLGRVAVGAKDPSPLCLSRGAATGPRARPPRRAT